MPSRTLLRRVQQYMRYYIDSSNVEPSGYSNSQTSEFVLTYFGYRKNAMRAINIDVPQTQLRGFVCFRSMYPTLQRFLQCIFGQEVRVFEPRESCHIYSQRNLYRLKTCSCILNRSYILKLVLFNSELITFSSMNKMDIGIPVY